MHAIRQRSLVVIASLGVACSALVFAGGWAVERMRLGADDREAFGRVEQFVRSQFDRMTMSLDAIASTQAAAAEPVLSQPSEIRDLRPLFRSAASAVAGAAPAPVAITLYTNDGTPLAWAGRPSELTVSTRDAALPAGRFAGPSSLFLAPGPLGFRLVRVQPVVTGNARPPGRVGLVAVERLFSELASVGNASADSFSIETPLAPVFLRTVPEGVTPVGGPFTFVVESPAGTPLVEARVDPVVLQRVRREHRATVLYGAILVLALASLLLAGPVLDARSLARTTGAYLGATAAAALLVILARVLFAFALPPANTALLSPDLYHWPALGPLARHPADLLLTSLAALALVALATGPLERRRVTLRGRRWPAAPEGNPTVGFLFWLVAGGGGLALAVFGYERFLAETFRRATVDILHFSPHPWDAARMSVAFALLGCHAAFAWLAVLLLRLLLARWRFSPHDRRVEFTVLAAWMLPTAAVWAAWWNGRLASLPRFEALLVVAAVATSAAFGPKGHSRFRRASQGYRLIVAFFALLAPAVVMYPSLVFFHEATRQRAIETVFGPEVLNQLDNLEKRLGAAQTEIDAREAQLEAAVSVPATAGGDMRTDSAFQIWQGTALDRYRVSSAVELYNGSEMLVSRFALNLPEETSGQRWREEGCTWRTFAEISPFGFARATAAACGAQHLRRHRSARHHRDPRHPRQQRALVHLVAEPVPGAPARR